MVYYQVCLARKRKLTITGMISHEPTRLHSTADSKAITRVTRSQTRSEDGAPPYGLLAQLVIALYGPAYMGMSLTLKVYLHNYMATLLRTGECRDFQEECSVCEGWDPEPVDRTRQIQNIQLF